MNEALIPMGDDAHNRKRASAMSDPRPAMLCVGESSARDLFQGSSPGLERFFIEALGGEPLDALQHAEERKADFRCLRGLLAVELKSLEEDGSERLRHLTEELRKRPDWPMFLGAAPLDAHLKHLDEPEEARRLVVERTGRAIKNHVRKANKQLAAHAAAFPRKNIVKVMVLANEDHQLYDPETVIHVVHRLLVRQENGRPLHADIDAVLFLTERHAASVTGQVGFPVCASRLRGSSAAHGSAT